VGGGKLRLVLRYKTLMIQHIQRFFVIGIAIAVIMKPQFYAVQE